MKGLKLMIKNVMTVIQVLMSVSLVLIVLFQSGKSAGLSSALVGTSDTFMQKNKGKSLDAQLAKMTKWVAVMFVLLTMSLHMIK